MLVMNLDKMYLFVLIPLLSLSDHSWGDWVDCSQSQYHRVRVGNTFDIFQSSRDKQFRVSKSNY